MKKILILVLVLVCFAGIGFAVSRKAPSNSAQTELSNFQKNAPIEITSSSIKTMQEIEALEDKEKPVIALFYVDWCTYCRKFMPVFAKTAERYNPQYNFAAVHCEKPENLKMVYEFGIQGFPSLYIIDPVIDYKFALTGAFTRDDTALERELDKYLEVRKHFTK